MREKTFPAQVEYNKEGVSIGPEYKDRERTKEAVNLKLPHITSTQRQRIKDIPL